MVLSLIAWICFFFEIVSVLSITRLLFSFALEMKLWSLRGSDGTSFHCRL